MGDAAFLVVALAIGYVEQSPLSDTALVLIFSCVFLGTALAITPFILDFSAARQEDLIEARAQLESLAQKLSESADFIGTVAGQLQSLNEATVKAIHMAESLPYKMQEKVGELAQLVQQDEDEEKEAMAAELEELRESEGKHLEVEIDKARVVLEAAVRRIETAEKALVAATTAFESHAAATPSPAGSEGSERKPRHAAHSERETPPAKEPESTGEPPVPESKGSNGGTEPASKHRKAAKPPKREKPPSPSKMESRSGPGHEQPPPASKETPPAPAPAQRKRSAAKPKEDEILPGLDPVVVRDDDAGDDDGGATAKTSDGSTRLLVTAYIGIGNKVFVRGDGPGLSAEKGQPMEFVSIGKWLWQTSEATAPVTVQVYKNDEVKALGEDITIDPGHHVEVTPVFRDPNPF